ncbi:MAG: hypothetical protein ACYSR6_01920, partial [Planctomycetota bacterium]
LLCNGCGFISILATPTRHEQKVPAEYALQNHTNEKILVLVHQPGWLDARTNLRYHLTDAIHKELFEKIRIPPMHVIPYGKLSEFRSERPDFLSLSAAEVGTALGADMVLFVRIDGYELSRFAETNYYIGFLNGQSNLYEASTGRRLWPTSDRSKPVRVGFDVGSGNREAAVGRLANAVAHCTVRYFYDCPLDEFKIGDDRSHTGWGS